MTDAAPSKKKRRGGPRRKTGCYTCKSRHSRCDEKKPVCSNCERLNLKCKPCDFIAPSEWSVNVSESTPTGPEDDLPAAISAPLENIDPTLAFDSLLYPNDELQETYPLLHEGGPTSTWDVFRYTVPGFEHATDDSPPADVLMNRPHPSVATFPVPTPDSVTACTLTSETAFLLQTYSRTLAMWMDVFDFDLTYQLDVARLMLTSPLLFHCVCAWTAKYLSQANSRHHSSWEPVARQHYGISLRLLIAALNTPSQEHCVTATIIATSYEILDALGDEHRRHFLGGYSLIKSRGICHQSTGIDHANFWIYVRHEVVVALANEQPVLLCPDEWNVSWKEGEKREDKLAKQVIWILARVINLVFGKDGTTPAGRQKREEMLRELEEWRSGLSDVFVGIPYGEKDDEGFQKVYFSVTAAAAGAFWYHIAHILLYTEPVLQDESYKPYIQNQAMLVANIVISEFPDSLRVFAMHGLYYAAKHIDGIARKARLWSVLNDVETQLGYHTSTTVKRLQALVEKA